MNTLISEHWLPVKRRAGTKTEVGYSFVGNRLHFFLEVGEK